MAHCTVGISMVLRVGRNTCANFVWRSWWSDAISLFVKPKWLFALSDSLYWDCYSIKFSIGLCKRAFFNNIVDYKYICLSCLWLQSDHFVDIRSDLRFKDQNLGWNETAMNSLFMLLEIFIIKGCWRHEISWPMKWTHYYLNSLPFDHFNLMMYIFLLT